METVTINAEDASLAPEPLVYHTDRRQLNPDWVDWKIGRDKVTPKEAIQEGVDKIVALSASIKQSLEEGTLAPFLVPYFRELDFGIQQWFKFWDCNTELEEKGALVIYPGAWRGDYRNIPSLFQEKVNQSINQWAVDRADTLGIARTHIHSYLSTLMNSVAYIKEMPEEWKDIPAVWWDTEEAIKSTVIGVPSMWWVLYKVISKKGAKTFTEMHQKGVERLAYLARQVK